MCPLKESAASESRVTSFKFSNADTLVVCSTKAPMLQMLWCLHHKKKKPPMKMTTMKSLQLLLRNQHDIEATLIIGSWCLALMPSSVSQHEVPQNPEASTNWASSFCSSR